MLSETQIYDEVQKHVAWCREIGKKGALIPKRAIVVDTTEHGILSGFRLHAERVLVGRAYPHYYLMPQRTVFKPEPKKFNGESFYVEIKGYGANGRHLYAMHHCEGDLFYGMYLEHARREFNLLKSVQNVGRVHLPLALLYFSHEEFTRQAFRGLASRAFNKTFSKSKEEIPKELGRTEIETAKKLFAIYQHQGLESALNLLRPYCSEYNYRMFDEFSTVKNPAGYLIRAARCPFRITDSQKGLLKSDLEEAAYMAGQTYARMITQGILHLVPSEGNITFAGELMDMEDAVTVDNLTEIRKSWQFMSQQFRDEKTDTFNAYLSLTLGRHFLGAFTSAFIEGTGLGDTPNEVASRVIERHETSLRPLLQERI
ncbi:MAG: hypothetical protein HY363_00470 [Candidatus Aenigmarchaeota archaeon]|nr:hypothetical protein [Candidatus Aenigmarchaeota archaeon]